MVTSDNSTKAASTAFVQGHLANYLTIGTEQSVSGKKTFSNICISPLLQFYDSGYSMNMRWSASETMRHLDFTSHGKSAGIYLALENNDGSKWDRILTTADYSTIQQQTVPTGTILPFCGANAPSGFLICNGGEISRTAYEGLFRVIGTAYGGGNGSTTFNLPNMHHRFLEGTTTASEVNTYVSAGLPNITGGFNARRSHGASAYAYGAFNEYGAGSGGYQGGGYGTIWNFDFYASRSSGLYGSSDTIQPFSIRILYIVKY